MKASTRLLAFVLFTLTSAAFLPAQAKPDALLNFRQGRDLESRGLMAEAKAKYQLAVDICDKELVADPSRVDAYVVKCWSLFRLQRYQDVIDNGQAALKIRFDARVVETMGEAYYFLNNMEAVVVSMRRYLESVGEAGDRVSTAYFYLGETYMRQRKFNHAYISYVAAVHYEAGMARWWFRLGQAAEAIGEPSRALEAYTKALQLAPAMSEATEALARAKSAIQAASAAASTATTTPAPTTAAPAGTTTGPGAGNP